MIKVDTIVSDAGVVLEKRYSDKHVLLLRQDGALFDVAIDPSDSGRSYTETDVPVPSDVSEADKDAALRRFGVEV